MIANQEAPVSRLKPTPNSASRNSVEPVKPKALASISPTTEPAMPPGASGNCTFKLYKRKCSNAELLNNTSTKPTKAANNERRSLMPALSMR